MDLIIYVCLNLELSDKNDIISNSKNLTLKNVNLIRS